MSRWRRITTKIAMLSSMLSMYLYGCTLANDIDVCERTLPLPKTVNVRNEGDQRITGAQAIAPLANGGAFVVFASDVSGATDDSNSEIRGTRLDNEGARLPTCYEPSEFTYAEPVFNGADVQQKKGASVGMPENGDEAGLISFVSIDDNNYSIYVQAITADGCTYQNQTPVKISAEEPNTVVSLPSVISMGDWKFAVVWVSVLNGNDFRVRARVVLVDKDIQFLPVTDAATGTGNKGEPVDIINTGYMPAGADAVCIGDGRFAIVWVSLVSHVSNVSIEVYYAVLNDKLETEGGPFKAYSSSGFDRVPEILQPDIAYDGKQLFIVWQSRDTKGINRIYGRFATIDGNFLPAGSTENNQAFRISNNKDGEEGWVAATERFDGGFFVTWVLENSSEETSTSQLMARVYNSERKEQFINFGCGREQFRLVDKNNESNSNRISLTTLSNGTIVAVWTDTGSNEVTQRGYSSVRSSAFEPRNYLPIE